MSSSTVATERGKEGEDSETDEDEEEEVNFTNCVNPSRTTDLLVIKTITMKNNDDEKDEQERGEDVVGIRIMVILYLTKIMSFAQPSILAQQGRRIMRKENEKERGKLGEK